MAITSRRNNLNKAELEKIEEREYWHKLVIKIILWKETRINSTSNLMEKVTPKEWKTYCQKTLKTNITYGKIKVSENLKQTWQAISQNGGFDKE